MSRIEINATQLRDVSKSLGAEELLLPHLPRTLKKAGLLLEGAVKDGMPVDTGRARNSVTTEMDANRIPNWVEVGSNLGYMEVIENGSVPHWAPVGSLQPWARRHGFPPGREGDYLARLGIARHGTPAFHPFAGAVESQESKIMGLFDKMVVDIANGF